MNTHTPAPWHVHPSTPTFIFDQNGARIGDTHETAHMANADRANAAHIVAAVNFVNGYETQYLPAIYKGGSLRIALDNLAEKVGIKPSEINENPLLLIEAIYMRVGDLLRLVDEDEDCFDDCEDDENDLERFRCPQCGVIDNGDQTIADHGMCHNCFVNRGNKPGFHASNRVKLLVAIPHITSELVETEVPAGTLGTVIFIQESDEIVVEFDGFEDSHDMQPGELERIPMFNAGDNVVARKDIEAGIGFSRAIVVKVGTAGKIVGTEYDDVNLPYMVDFGEGAKKTWVYPNQIQAPQK